MGCIAVILGLFLRLEGDLGEEKFSDVEHCLLNGKDETNKLLVMEGEKSHAKRQESAVLPYIGIAISDRVMSDKFEWRKFISLTSTFGLTLNTTVTERFKLRNNPSVLLVFDVDTSKVNIRRDSLFSKLRKNREIIQYVGIFTLANGFVFDEIGFYTKVALNEKDRELLRRYGLVPIATDENLGNVQHYFRGPSDAGSLMLEIVDSLRKYPSILGCNPNVLLNFSH